MQLTHADFINIEKELCRRSLAEFVRQAWPVIDPGMPLKWGWHMDAICEHLEAVTNGELTRLLINVPPGTSKSSLVNVYWPAWEWITKPSTRIISASHEQELAIRDTTKMRRLITSEWFSERWPIKLTADQNQKTSFENDATGFRQARAVKSMTGRRGDRVIWDDPQNVEDAFSEVERPKAIRVFQETLPTRLNDPEKSAVIIVMQRLHEEDVSGFILSDDYGYEHLCLPMEFEPERKCYTSIGWEDPRTEEGELLFPERFPREVVERDKKIMGTFAYAGQMQQRPAPRGGGFFDWEKIDIVSACPALTKTVRYWDKAGTEGGGARTAGVKMGIGSDGVFYITDVVKGQWEAPKREAVIRQTAETDGVNVNIWIEQEPGSGGKESAQSTIRNLAGFTIKKEPVSGSKEARAEPLSVQIEAGNVKLVRGEWNKEFIDELKLFPASKFKDQVDASSGAFNKLSLGYSKPDDFVMPFASMVDDM